MRAIVNGRLLLPEGEKADAALLFDEKILAVTREELPAGTEVIDAGGCFVSPGLIDTHIHGCAGADASDADAEGLKAMAGALLKNGVTGFLPTTMTVAWDTLEAVFRQVRQLMPESRRAEFPGAEILGCHAEGPFINPEKKGAQAEENILPPDAEKILPFSDVIRLITFAPEMPGAAQFIETIREKTEIGLSVGHTAATFEQAMGAVNMGAGRFTHLFNAMPPVHHRFPGAAAAALCSGAYAELIADGIHVHPALFPLLYRLKGEKLVLITDSLRAAGMPDGEYTLGGQRFTLRGRECRLESGVIAGSVLRLNEAVLLLRDHAGIPLHAAVRAASLSAAESAGLSDTKGSLTPGKDADIVLMDENCRVKRTIVRGVTKYTGT